MKESQRFTLIALLALAVAGVVGLILSRTTSLAPPQNKSSQGQGASSVAINQEYLNTAGRLLARAATADEQQVAQAAVRIADQELDLAFAAALQAAGRAPVTQTPEVRDIKEKIQKIQAAIEAKQAEVKQLTDAAKTARPKQRDSVQQQLDVSQAELNFYKERLDDVKEDLIRVGGDPQSKIQQLVDEHKAASHAADSVKTAPISQPPPEPSSLLAKWSKWKTIREKQGEVVQALQEALNAAEAMVRQRAPVAGRVDAEQAQRKPVAVQAPSADKASPLPSSPTAGVDSNQTAAARVALLQSLAEDRKELAILDGRTRDLKDLGATYGKWVLLIKADQRAALHDIIASALAIALLMLLAFIINRLAERFFDHLKLESKQRATLQAVTRVGVQVLAVLVVLIVIFGPPSQLSTVLGLAGAGLTVVLKDFIVSFLGWFVLMGRHGIRVGDSVEINGVRGEVIEITLLRTVLLETGNWTDSGGPPVARLPS